MRNNPFEDFSVFEAFGDIFSGPLFQGMNLPDPKVQQESNAEGATLRIALPGFEKDEVKVSVVQGLLKVSAKKAEESKGYFEGLDRSFRLNGTHDVDAIEAELKNGLLVVTIPRLKGATDKIDISVD